jgi:serine/threonine protein kinase
MRKYFDDGYSEDLKGKLTQFYLINRCLNSIHKQGLIHRDFHSGNILSSINYKPASFFITDLGLSRPANETDKERVYGVLSYVAPELLTEGGKKYSQASDVYSLGIVAYELFSGLPPYYDLNCSDEISRAVLTVKICQGLRPNLNEIKLPQLLKDLISSC